MFSFVIHTKVTSTHKLIAFCVDFLHLIQCNRFKMNIRISKIVFKYLQIRIFAEYLNICLSPRLDCCSSVQWNLSIIDTLGPAKCPDYQGLLIFQVSLHEIASVGTTAKCVD